MPRKLNSEMQFKTTVDVVRPIKEEFDTKTKFSQMNMGKLLARSMYLYVNDEDFKKAIDECVGVKPYVMLF